MPFSMNDGNGNGNGQGSGSGPRPPDIEEIFNKLRKSFNNFGGTVWILLAIVVAGGLFSCFFTVGVDEVGVVQRFGKYDRTATPGLSFKLPNGIEKVTKVRVKYVYKEEFGLRTLVAGRRTQYAPGKAYLGESLMLTGDLNVAVVPWIVQYRITDERKFLFAVRDVQTTLRDLAEASMRLVVGDRSINEVITKREEIADQATELLQKELDQSDTGLSIVTIEMKKTNVPEPVQASFNEVNQAVQEKEKMIYQAREAFNKVIPAARGQADKMLRDAEGYAMDRVNRAKGDANRFLAMYEEYRKAREVTRRRLYLEAMKDVLPKMKEITVVDEDQKNLLPLLNLGSSRKGGAK